MEKTCKYGFNHDKLGVPCTECRMDMYKDGKSAFDILDEIEKIRKKRDNFINILKDNIVDAFSKYFETKDTVNGDLIRRNE